MKTKGGGLDFDLCGSLTYVLLGFAEAWHLAGAAWLLLPINLNCLGSREMNLECPLFYHGMVHEDVAEVILGDLDIYGCLICFVGERIL